MNTNNDNHDYPTTAPATLAAVPFESFMKLRKIAYTRWYGSAYVPRNATTINRNFRHWKNADSIVDDYEDRVKVVNSRIKAIREKLEVDLQVAGHDEDLQLMLNQDAVSDIAILRREFALWTYTAYANVLATDYHCFKALEFAAKCPGINLPHLLTELRPSIAEVYKANKAAGLEMSGANGSTAENLR